MFIYSSIIEKLSLHYNISIEFHDMVSWVILILIFFSFQWWWWLCQHRQGQLFNPITQEAEAGRSEFEAILVSVSSMTERATEKTCLEKNKQEKNSINSFLPSFHALDVAHMSFFVFFLLLFCLHFWTPNTGLHIASSPPTTELHPPPADYNDPRAGETVQGLRLCTIPTFTYVRQFTPAPRGPSASGFLGHLHTWKYLLRHIT